MALVELHSDVDHDQYIQQNPRVLIFFGRNQGPVPCGHCLDMMPLVRGYVSTYPNVKFAHIETSQVPIEMNGQTNVPVPYFVGYAHGQPIFIVLGADPVKLRSELARLNGM